MDRDDFVRDVYAHFGLAIYKAQVLEHGLANAMLYASQVAGRWAVGVPIDVPVEFIEGL